MSRKIDALIAEKVMGLWVGPNLMRTDYECTEYVFVNPDRGEHSGRRWDGPKRRVPDYSTSIAAAWDVVEKMRIDGWNFSMLGEAPRTPPRTSIPSDKDPKNRFRFHNLMHQPPKDPNGADEATMPLAICVASLRALGVPDVEILAAMAKSDGRAEE